MAIKPTIYKLRIALSDLNRDYYDSLNLTVALHPSETLERMMARTMAFSLNAQENLSFTKGLSAIEEPDIWVQSLDGLTQLWIDVGEPNSDRVKKATRSSPAVSVYSFNSKSDVWWSQGEAKFKTLKANFYRFNWSEIEALAQLVERTMDLSITITGDSAYIATDTGTCEVSWENLHTVDNT